MTANDEDDERGPREQAEGWLEMAFNTENGSMFADYCIGRSNAVLLGAILTELQSVRALLERQEARNAQGT